MRRLLTIISLLMATQVFANVDLEVLDNAVCSDLVDVDSKRSRLFFNRPSFFRYDSKIFFIKKGWETNQITNSEDFGHVVHQLNDDSYAKFLMPAQIPLLDYKVAGHRR